MGSAQPSPAAHDEIARVGIDRIFALDPATDAAKIRAFFVHPSWARRGLGTRLLEACEQAAWDAGFRRCEMGATLSGVPLYERHGYRRVAEILVDLPGGERLPVVRMEKLL